MDYALLDPRDAVTLPLPQSTSCETKGIKIKARAAWPRKLIPSDWIPDRQVVLLNARESSVL